MDEATLIATVQNYLNDNLSAEVRTRGEVEDGRPVPVVVLDDYDITDIEYHNTHLAHVVETNSPGTPDERYFRFHYWARFDYLIRARGDVDVVQLRDRMKSLFEPLTESPEALHDHLNDVELRGGGGFTTTNVENAESETALTVRFRTFHQTDNSEDSAFDSSSLDQIENDLDAGDGENFTTTH